MNPFPHATPGCHCRHEPLSDYLDCADHVSSSMLRRFARTGSLASARTISAPGSEAILGDALHALLLEPERFDAQYFETADGSRPDHATAQEDLLDRTWLPAASTRALRAMRRSVDQYTREPLAEWLRLGHKELSIYWSDEAGARFKARPDCFLEDVVLELKTAADIRPGPFARTRRRFGYDLQAAHYLEGVARLTGRSARFLYLTVESVSPHAVWAYELAGEDLDRARAELDGLRERFRAEDTMTAGTK